MTEPVAEVNRDTASASRYCGAKKRQGEGNCTRPAGWGTDHVGLGRCKLHGGCVPIKHGRYSKLKQEALRSSIEHFEQDQDPLDLLPEVAAMRALFANFGDRYDELVEALLAWNAEEYADATAEQRKPKPQRIPAIEDAANLLDGVSKIVARIEKARSASAVSRPELMRILGEYSRVVERHVTDEETLKAISDDILAVRL